MPKFCVGYIRRNGCKPPITISMNTAQGCPPPEGLSVVQWKDCRETAWNNNNKIEIDAWRQKATDCTTIFSPFVPNCLPTMPTNPCGPTLIMAAPEPQKIVVDDGFTANSSLKLLDLPDDLAALILGGQRWATFKS